MTLRRFQENRGKSPQGRNVWLTKQSHANPIIVDEANVVLAGHGRLEAAKLLGLNEVPVLRRLGLSPAQKRAYMIADNKLTERAGWNRSELVVELSDLADALMIEGLDFDLSITGSNPRRSISSRPIFPTMSMIPPTTSIKMR